MDTTKTEPIQVDTLDLQTGIEHALATFSPADATISEMRANYMPLTVDGLKDRAGLAVVHEARMEVKRHRVAVEKTRKALKADALAFGRNVDAEAKRITALLEPIESHLKAEEDKVAEEKARLKREAEEARRAALQERMDELGELGSSLLPMTVEGMTDGEFGAAVVSERDAQEVRVREAAIVAERVRAEEQDRAEAAELVAAEQRIEYALLEAEREKLAEERDVEAGKAAAERKRLAEEQAKLDAARMDLAEETAKAEAARVRAETKARVERRAADEASDDTPEALRDVCLEFGIETAGRLRDALTFWSQGQF